MAYLDAIQDEFRKNRFYKGLGFAKRNRNCIKTENLILKTGRLFDFDKKYDLCVAG